MLLLGLGLGGARASAQRPADSLAPASVYVPVPCAGQPARRCPLVVFPQVTATIMRTTSAARALLAQQQRLADRYGAILLVPSSATVPVATDTLLQRVLETYAVDPARVTLIGYRIRNSCADPAVFSRVALLSPDFVHGGDPLCDTEGSAPAGSSARAARVYLNIGLGDRGGIPGIMRRAPTLRQAGHALELVLVLRGYAAEPDDFARLWQWLAASWTAPALPVVPAEAAPGPWPLLTMRALRRLIAFWTRFQQLPDSIRTTARQRYQQASTVPVAAERFGLPAGAERFTLGMLDTPALAVRYPAVRAALRAAGLSAREADAYRQALIVAAANWPRGVLLQPLPQVTVASRLDRNIVFLQTHQNALKALGATGMWVTP